MIHMRTVRFTKFAVKGLVTHGGLIKLVKMYSIVGNLCTDIVYLMSLVMGTRVQGQVTADFLKTEIDCAVWRMNAGFVNSASKA